MAGPTIQDAVYYPNPANQAGNTPGTTAPSYLPGVTDTSLLDRFKSWFSSPTDSAMVGGAGPDTILNSAASQDVPQGPDTRAFTDPTATSTTPQAVASSPGVFKLLWNSITGSGPGLFSCRDDSIICAGTGSQAAKAGMTTPTGAAGTNWLGSLQSTLIIAVVGIVLLLILVKKLSPA